MEAHHALSKRGYNICSYGTNSMIKIPGMTADRPNSYSFGTTYEDIQADLRRKDQPFYTQNGLLLLLDRNKAIKAAPQRFQDRLQSVEDEEPFDVVISCEERCFDIINEDLLERGLRGVGRVLWVVNFDIRDTPEDAAVGARHIVQFVQDLEEAAARGEGENGVARVFDEWQRSCKLPFLYTIHFT